MKSVSRKNIITTVVLTVLFFAPALATAQVAWVEDFNSALKQAAREKKFIFLDMSASW